MVRSLTRRLWMAFAATSLLGLVMLAGCGLGGSDQVDVEVVDFGMPAQGVEWVDGAIWVWLEDEGAESIRVDELLRLDSTSAAITQRVPIPNGFRAPEFLVDGSVHVERRLGDDLTRLEGPPVLGDTGLLEDDDNRIVMEVDLESGQPVAQYVLPGPAFLAPTVVEGTDMMWYSTSGRNLVGVDLATGEVNRGPSGGWSTYPELVDGWIWQIGGFEALKIDPVTGDVVSEFQLERPPEVESDLTPVSWTLTAYDGKYWIPGDFNLDPDNAYELNLETGEVGESVVPADEVPAMAVDTEEHRWERYSGSDRWIWSEFGSGETLGEFNFGGFTPLAELDDYLWLFSYGDGQLGRVPLEDLMADGG